MFRKAVFILVFFVHCYFVKAQCSGFPATTADADCSTSTSTLTSGANVSGGGNYGYCGSNTPASYSNINLSGGTIRICGNATISFSAVNSGVLVVSCGATLTINSSLTLNSNVGIVNYGTVIINGDLTFQNNNNYVYNESKQSKLTVTGNVNFNSNSGSNGYVKNAGYIKVGGNYNALAGAFTCFLDGGQMECNNLVYMDNNSLCNGVAGNRFTFGSSSGNCILRYITNANLYNTFTSDNHWSVYKASGSTQTLNSCNSHTGSWGSAVITANAPALTVPANAGVQNCTVITCLTTTLPIELINFTATATYDKVNLNWSTATETDNNYFTIEKSTDAINFEEVTRIKGAGNSTQVLSYSAVDNDPYGGLSYYRLKQTDNNGQFKYMPIISVENKNNRVIISNIHPNPTTTNFSFDVYSPNKGTIRVQLSDNMGRIVLDNTHAMPENQSKIYVETTDLPQGLYILKASVLETGTSTVYKILKN